MSTKLCVAVDAMGGDGGWPLVNAAAKRALLADARLQLLLVGDADQLALLLAAWPAGLRARVEVHAASQALAMDAGAAQAVRNGQRTSLGQAIELLHTGAAQAMVSAGSTAAMMGLARHRLGMLAGLERPALMTAIPVQSGQAWLLDLGANIGVDAARLVEFAQLGSAAAGVLSGRKPRVGLLNIGREDNKGPDVLRETRRRLAEHPEVDCIGFVEADQVFAGAVDVVVCDGFAGNILLKTAEGMARLMTSALRQQVGRGWRAWALRRPLRTLQSQFDPAHHDGAALLGVRGVVVKSHGSTCERGLANAIRLAAQHARGGLVAALDERLSAGR